MHPLIQEWVNQKGVHPDYMRRQDERQQICAQMQIASVAETREVDMGRKPAKAVQALKLMEALSFVEAATEDHGQPMFEFVNLQNKRAICFDGVLAAGMEIEEELTLAPKLETLKKALAKSGKSLTLTELSSGRLSVKGEKLVVQVPCVQPTEMPVISPDLAIAAINDELKEAFKALENIIADSGERVFETALLLQANVATATNGKILMQYWHGIDLPPNLVLPRPFIQAVSKQFKSLVAFGYSTIPNATTGEPEPKSVTFWFEDGSWYKTQVYQDKFPDCDKLLNQPNSPTDAPEGLWEGCAQIAEFHDNEWITFNTGSLEAGTATYPVEGLQEGKQFAYQYLKKIVPLVKTIDLTTYSDRAFFFGEKVRGVIMTMKEGT